MSFTSKRTSLIILAITALTCSRTMFAFINDPEGPNLLIVTVLAAIVYGLSLAVYVPNFSITGPKKLLLAIFIQVLIVASLYLVLN